MNEVRSMTGFTAIDGLLPDGVRGFGLTLKSVNHRHLDLALRLPLGLEGLEPALRAAIKAEVRRGHIELTLILEKSAAGAVQLDESLLAEYAKVFRRTAAMLDLSQEPDLNAMLRLPGAMAPAAGVTNAAAIEPAVLEAAAALLTRFNQARAAEGEALAVGLRAGMERMQQLIEEAARLREGVGASEFAWLKTRLAELLAGSDVSEDRLLTEAALLAARGDVEEELVRLRTHIARFIELLNAGGEVGRPLDFLLQEMNREANTSLSKSGGNAGEGGLRLTAIGLEMKVELERAREQVQNLE